MNTELRYCYVQERFEPYQFQPIQRGLGVWYNPKEERYYAAILRAKAELLDAVYEEFPHLKPAQPAPMIQKVEPSHMQPIIQKEKSKDELHIASLKEIMDCTNVDELKTFELWAKKNGASETYKLKLEELSK